MDTLMHLFQQFNAYAKVNPLVAGAMSLWGLGVITWVCRGVPRAIWGFCKRQYTTSLSFTSDTAGTNAQTFAAFMRWFQQSRWARWSRSLSILPSDSGELTYGRYGGVTERIHEDDGTVIGVGEGSHFFLYRGWPFWLRHSRIKEGGNQNRITYEVKLTGLGRNRQRVLDLIEEFRYRPSPRRTGVYRWDRNDWTRACDVLKRPLSTVVIDPAIKGELLANMERWMASREWYEQRGLPYKLTCILRGLPGTGKTSLIKALAGHFGMDVCLLNLASMTDATFESALSEAPRKSFVVIEDFDSTSATKARRALKAKETQAANAAASAGDESMAELFNMGLTLSGILNALDGLLSLDGKIVFLTTNVYEALDPALIRKGRVDYTYEIGKLTDPEVREYVRVMFPDDEAPMPARFADILGCDLQDLYFAHRDSASAFIAAIPKAGSTAQVFHDKQPIERGRTIAAVN